MITFNNGADLVAIAADLNRVDTQIGFMHSTLNRAVSSYEHHGLAESKLPAMLETSVYLTQKTLHLLEGINPFITAKTLSRPIAVIYGVLFQLEESKRMDTSRNELLSVLQALLLIITDVRATVANINRLANGHEMEFAA